MDAEPLPDVVLRLIESIPGLDGEIAALYYGLEGECRSVSEVRRIVAPDGRFSTIRIGQKLDKICHRLGLALGDGEIGEQEIADLVQAGIWRRRAGLSTAAGATGTTVADGEAPP